MAAVLADTHALVWYLADRRRLSGAAVAALDGATAAGEPIWLSAVTWVELVYLVEKGRLPATLLARLDAELGRSNSALAVAALDLPVARALTRIARDDVPDMPDRIIAATALARGLPLVTRDARIRTAAIQTIR